MLEQWLKAGILEDGYFFESEVESPQNMFGKVGRENGILA
jgi:hypothetical protein